MKTKTRKFLSDMMGITAWPMSKAGFFTSEPASGSRSHVYEDKKEVHCDLRPWPRCWQTADT